MSGSRVPRPSSQDVADRVGVSRATVSAYLNKTRYVSPGLSERIQLAIDELGYVPDPVARALKTSDTSTVGLIIPVMTSFYMPMINAIEREAASRGYELLISSSNEDRVKERELLDVLVAKRVTGIVITPCSDENSERINAILRSGVPVAQVNRRLEGVDADSVVSDNFRAAYQATEHLVRRGSRRIAFLGYDESNIANLRKKLGYEAAVRDLGVAEGLVIAVREHDRDLITARLEAFIDGGNRFDALIATTQGKTVIALRTLVRRGYRVPEDVALIGFDDTPWCELLSPPLTMISEDTSTMGAESLALLIGRIEGSMDGPARHVVLEDRMIIRLSA